MPGQVAVDSSFDSIQPDGDRQGKLQMAIGCKAGCNAAGVDRYETQLQRTKERITETIMSARKIPCFPYQQVLNKTGR